MVHKNNIEDIPNFIQKLPKLNILDIQNIKLTRIPDWLKDFKEKNELYL
jgi:Leucine-rich repeat (LRR) protein